MGKGNSRLHHARFHLTLWLMQWTPTLSKLSVYWSKTNPHSRLAKTKIHANSSHAKNQRKKKRPRSTCKPTWQTMQRHTKEKKTSRQPHHASKLMPRWKPQTPYFYSKGLWHICKAPYKDLRKQNHFHVRTAFTIHKQNSTNVNPRHITNFHIQGHNHFHAKPYSFPCKPHILKPIGKET